MCVWILLTEWKNLPICWRSDWWCTWVHCTDLLSPFPQVWWSPTHTHTHTHTRKWVSRIPIPPLSHSHPTENTDTLYTTHLETVSLVHQKPLPLGGEMHLLCILWSHTREDSQIFSFTTDTDIHPSQHAQEVVLPETPVSRSMHCTPLQQHLCGDTHTYTQLQWTFTSLSSHCKSMHSWQSLHSNKKGLGTYQTAYNYVGRHSNIHVCLWENEVFPRPFFNPVPRQEWYGNEVWCRSGMGMRFGTL